MRDTITSPRVEIMKRKQRIYRVRLSVLVFILIISIVGGFSYFSFHPRINFRSIVITGTRIVNPADIESRTREDISGKYFYMFSKSNSFIYPYKKIYNDLLIQFPRIEKLSIYRDNLQTLHIDISERLGSYLYCGINVPESTKDIGENCYFINNDGYIFDKAPYFSGNIYLKYYKDLENGESTNPLSLQLAPAEDFHTLTRFIDNIISLGLKPAYITLEKDGTNSLYLDHSEMASSPKIIFKNNDNLDILFDNLLVSMKKQEFADEINSKYNKLLYIDLRFNNKVIYKFQDE